MCNPHFGILQLFQRLGTNFFNPTGWHLVTYTFYDVINYDN